MELLIPTLILLVISISAVLWGTDSTRLSELESTERHGVLR
jgi:hypothetical protein